MRSILAFGTVVLLSTALLAGVAAADGGTTAVVDRTGDDYAVLLIEEDGETTDQRVVDPAELDAEGRYEGAVHRVVDGDYVYDEAETRRRQTANSRTYAGTVV
ncbi:DUF3006 domain-containing protein [Natronomonas salina]|uniref:DUF3006 domain-containing protein n=1 Tax=Natronomonas salina TaxID=1710540 RepID=UPI0015B3C28D|nr:DUF3006 domain-containing protein [Natronomonas salina]QLD87865.1 DUF3006 domain-containing protein [Natronomonas salina]